MKYNKLFIGAFSVLALASCNDKMEYKEYNIYDKDYITKNFGNVGGFMTDIYNTVDYDFGNYSGGAMQASATDESMYSKLGNSIEDFYNGAWSPSNAKGSLWNSMYSGIKVCNHVLEQMQGLTFDELVLNKDYTQQMHRYENYKYEARFMRAYFYFALVRQYGGVPLVTTEISADEANSISRASADDIFKFIIDECSDIQNKIIADYSDLGDYALGTEESGRADKLAVMAPRLAQHSTGQVLCSTPLAIRSATTLPLLTLRSCSMQPRLAARVLPPIMPTSGQLVASTLQLS